MPAFIIADREAAGAGIMAVNALFIRPKRNLRATSSRSSCAVLRARLKDELAVDFQDSNRPTTPRPRRAIGWSLLFREIDSATWSSHHVRLTRRSSRRGRFRGRRSHVSKFTRGLQYTANGPLGDMAQIRYIAASVPQSPRFSPSRPESSPLAACDWGTARPPNRRHDAKC